MNEGLRSFSSKTVISWGAHVPSGNTDHLFLDLLQVLFKVKWIHVCIKDVETF